MKREYIFIALLSLISLSLVGTQFVTSRDPLNDQIKSQDVTSITYAIDNYASSHKNLPSKLQDLTFSSPLRGKLSDYQYSITSTNKYKICADFKTDTSKNSNGSLYYTDTNSHTKGHACFDEHTYSIPDPVVTVYTPPVYSTQVKQVGDSCYSYTEVTSTGVFSSTSTDAGTKGTVVNYKRSSAAAANTSSFICANITVTNKSGQVIPISQLKAGDSITVYNDSSFASKISLNN